MKVLNQAVYLIGSPTQFGNDLFLESQEVYESTGSGVAVYASIDNPSEHLRRYLSSETPVAHCPYDPGNEKWFVDNEVRQEIESLLL